MPPRKPTAPPDPRGRKAKQAEHPERKGGKGGRPTRNGKTAQKTTGTHNGKKTKIHPTPDPVWDAQMGEWVNNANEPICGAQRSANSPQGPGICCLRKGFGTDHVGFGRCKYHGGRSPGGTIAATKEMITKQRPILGGPLPIGPHEAILMEVQHTAGHVQWLRQMIQIMGQDQVLDEVSAVDEALKPDEQPAVAKRAGDPTKRGWDKTLTQVTPDLRISISVWMEMYQKERSHLVAVCKAAVTMGVAERAVRIAEDQGQLMASVIMAIFNDTALGLTYEQRLAFPEIARRHLEAADPALAPPAQLDATHTRALPMRGDTIDAPSAEGDETFDEY